MRKQTKRNYGTGRDFLAGVTLLLLMVMGCDSATSPNQDLRSNDLPETMQSGDRMNTGYEDASIYTEEGFYFLAPMVKDSEYSGTFDGGLSPVVEICETTACDALHASFDMNGDGSEQVRGVEEDEHYIVNWSTNLTGALAGKTYRVRVLVSGLVLGYADVTVVSNGREAVEVSSDGSIALIANQTLPVKFRIETGIVGTVLVTPAETSIEVGATQPFTAELFDLRGEPLSGPAVMWTSDDTAVADVDGDGLATGKSSGQAVITAASGPAVGSSQLSVTTDSIFFLADNGVTIQCPAAAVGEKGFVGGEEYEAVDNALLSTRSDEGADLTLLCTTPVTGMSNMFRDDADFNQNIGGWDTGNVTAMSFMFFNASSFNHPIGDWNTGKVEVMSIMFASASTFDQDIGGWETSNVMSMFAMFAGATAFNKDISGWNTAGVIDMRGMFNNATAFNQNLSGWCVSLITSLPNGFDTRATSWVLPNSRPDWGASCQI